MHIGLLAAAAHAAATNSCFTIFFNPRASPSEFVIPLSKYFKAVHHTRVSVGMRFRMLFETEESSVRRYMGTITGIGDLDPVRWPNSHWRSVKVGWDESTAGDRQPRVSLWEIEPLTTFPMYPSLFPLRLKRPWYPGASSFQDSRDEAVNGWLRGESGEQGLNLLNFQSAGMFPWMQQRIDPAFVRNDLNQQYQAMLAAGLQNGGGGDSPRQQFMQFQQPVQYLQAAGSHIELLQQQGTQQSGPHILNEQTHMLPENHYRQLQKQLRSRPEEHHSNSYPEAYQIQSDLMQQRQQANVLLPSYPKSDFADPNSKLSVSVSPSSMQNMLGSLSSEGSGNLMNFSVTGHSMLGEQPTQQSWVSKFAPQQVHASASLSHPPYSAKGADVEQESSNLDPHNQVHFGSNIDSSGLLLPTTVSSIGTSTIEADIPSMSLGASGYHSSLYSYMQDSSELLHSAGHVDPPTPSSTFVKVYKSGSVGRSLDITRFNSYNELREELGQMFGIEGFLEDPQRSGWQLVFVDRENDVLLLGDDPWEAFVNNVWYIKILSPEDVQKLGKQELESFSQNTGERMNSSGNDDRDVLCGLPSLGSLEY